MNKILFVIPARSGSKGIKDKNIQNCGKDTLLRQSVKKCLNIKFDADIYVSTDSNKYLEHIKDLIDNPPFLRPKYLSDDLVSDIEVLIHALHTCENFYKRDYKCVVMIQPTCPLRKKQDVVKTIEAIINDNYDSAVTCQKIDKKYHPFKSLYLDNKGYLGHFIKQESEIIARQQLDTTYIRNGASYSITPKQLCLGKSFFNCRSKLVLTESVLSIDSYEELKYCEQILLKEN